MRPELPRVVQSCPELSRVAQSCPELPRVAQSYSELLRVAIIKTEKNGGRTDGPRDTPSYRDARSVRWLVCWSDRRFIPLTKCGGVTDDGNPNPDRKGSGTVGGGGGGGVLVVYVLVLAVQYSTLT